MLFHGWVLQREEFQSRGRRWTQISWEASCTQASERNLFFFTWIMKIDAWKCVFFMLRELGKVKSGTNLKLCPQCCPSGARGSPSDDQYNILTSYLGFLFIFWQFHVPDVWGGKYCVNISYLPGASVSLRAIPTDCGHTCVAHTDENRHFYATYYIHLLCHHP